MSNTQSAPAEPVVLVLMGVSGSGKSTLAALLAGRLGWDLEEGDGLHPRANIAKMASGHPLTDADRWPWLAYVSAWIRSRTESGRCGLITCSSLKRSYRDVLRGDHVIFVHLDGNHDLIAGRLVARHGHFMPVGLLDSQFETLEPPGADERAIRVDVAAMLSTQADELTARLGLHPTGATRIEARR